MSFMVPYQYSPDFPSKHSAQKRILQPKFIILLGTYDWLYALSTV